MVASRPSRPSTEQTKGVKCQRLSRQAPRYFLFFFVCFEDFGWKSFAVRLGVHVGDSDVKNATGASCPKTLNEDVTAFIFAGGTFICWFVCVHACKSFLHLGYAIRANQWFVAYGFGVKAFALMCTSLSLISLWRKITRPPHLHPRACCRENGAPQPSHEAGRSGGASPYRMERASRNSCAESSVPARRPSSVLVKWYGFFHRGVCVEGTPWWYLRSPLYFAFGSRLSLSP